ncbi:hypothetical protein T492DRAFT_886092, partial [Pavlovales sp. CCMP2436]
MAEADRITVKVGGLSWASSFVTSITSVAVEVDVMGLRQPAERTKSESLLRREKLAFDFGTNIELLPGSREYARVARALKSGVKTDTEVRFTLLDMGGPTPLVLAESSVVLEQMLTRGRDKDGEPLQLSSARGELVGELTVSVLCVDTLRRVKAGDAIGPKTPSELVPTARTDGERIAALRLSSAKLDELRASFRSYDANNRGSITKLELRRALEAAGVKSTGEAVEAAFAKADADGDGKLTFTEFCELHALEQAGSSLAAPLALPAPALPESRQPLSSPSRALSDAERIAALRLSSAKLDELRASFRSYDANNSGSITKLELR